MSMDEKLCYEIRIKGRVQGVGFRHSAVREAKKNGITGYVRNAADGSVEIEAEGSRDSLNDFVEWCRKGPGFGYVESVTADPKPPGNYNDFRIEW
ncbi:MAG: acylphosphatase [Bacteroidota bacterium]|nr:acylphosphatase [Bacteroidota bacterium]